MNVRNAYFVGAAIVLLGSLAGGCFSRDPIDIKSQDPGAKIPAIKQAVQSKDLSSTRQLVNDLSSDDPAVRFYAICGLERLTGERFGYSYYADDDARKPAMKRWEEWLAKQENDAAAPTTTGVVAGK